MFTWLKQLDRHFPVRYSVWLLCFVGALLCAFAWIAFHMGALPGLIFVGLAALGFRDVIQTRHAVLRNYPVI